MGENILDKIAEIRECQPKKTRMLCNYLSTNPEKIGMMSVADLAAQAGVGTTTVLRFVGMLGYDSFLSFKKDIMNAVLLRKASPYQTLKKSLADCPRTESADTLRNIMSDGIGVLDAICSASNIEQFEKAVQMLLKAGNIYTLGMRSSRALALYFEYIIDRFSGKVCQLSDQGEYIFDKVISRMTPEDVLLVIATYPCTARTVVIGELCHKNRIPIILVTDTRINPLAKIADAVIDTDSVNHSSGDTACFAIIEALGAELGRRMAPESVERIEQTEKLLMENNCFIWES